LPTNRDIDTKDLIDIVKTSEEEVVYYDSSVDEVKQFIIQNNIKDGDNALSSDVIYIAFLKWLGSRYPGNKSSFFKKFGKYYKKKRVGGYSFYYVSGECFEVPEKTALVSRKQHGKNEKK
jgi:hypothetical protein